MKVAACITQCSVRHSIRVVCCAEEEKSKDEKIRKSHIKRKGREALLANEKGLWLEKEHLFHHHTPLHHTILTYTHVVGVSIAGEWRRRKRQKKKRERKRGKTTQK